MKLCMELATLLHIFALKITDKHQRKGYMEHSRRWQRHRYRINVLKDAQVYHPISVSDFDKSPYVFNCSNCTLHVKNRNPTKNKVEDKLTKISKVKYDPNAKSDRWDEFIDEIIRTFVDKIYVKKSEKIPCTITKKQTIWIQWNYIGVVNINPNTEKSA